MDNSISEREPRLTLESLQPIEYSLPWLRQKDMQADIEALQREVEVALRHLQNYKHNFFTEQNAVNYLKLSARAASTELQNWVRFNENYTYPPKEPQADNLRREWVQADVDYRRNSAVLLRDEAIKLRAQGKIEEANSKMELAHRFFNDYQSLKGGGLIRLSSAPRKELEETIGQEPGEIVGMFFDDQVVAAATEISEQVDALLDNKKTVPGVDAGLIRVHYALPGIFPEADREIEHLRQRVAIEHKVPLEQIGRYWKYYNNEILPPDTE